MRDTPEATPSSVFAPSPTVDKRVDDSAPPSSTSPLPSQPGTDTPAAAVPLTPEEQMARFAEELKAQDWGHQPC